MNLEENKSKQELEFEIAKLESANNNLRKKIKTISRIYSIMIVVYTLFVIILCIATKATGV